MYSRYILIIFALIGCSSLVGSPIDSLHRKATNLYLDGYYADAYFVYKKNITIQQENEDADKEFMARTHRNIGMCLVALNQIDKAEQHLNQAIKGYNEVLVDNRENTNYKRMVNRLGVCYQHLSLAMLNKGDYAEAVNTSQQALTQFELADRTTNIIRINNILANIYIESGDLDKAEKTCLDAIKQYTTPDSDPNLLADIYNTLAIVYENQADYKKAERYYKKAIELTDYEMDLARTYGNLAVVSTALKDYTTSKKNLDKALKIKQKVNDNSLFNFSYAPTFENFGDLEAAQNNFDTALNFYQKALVNLTDNFRSENIKENPAVTGGHYIYNKPDLLRLLDLKAQAARKSGNTKLAYQTYRDLDTWINEFYKDLNTNESKLTWIARAHSIYAHAISTALEKGDQEQAFQYAEKAHAVLLWQNLSTQAAQNLLSEEDINTRDDLVAKIRQADEQYRYAADKDKNELRRLINTLEDKRKQLEKRFEDKYPEYKKRKYQTESISVSDIQQKIIDDQTAFVEYYWTDDILYIFMITKKELQIIEQDPQGLMDDIVNFKNIITDKNSTTQSYHVLAHKLYGQLIPSRLSANDDIKRLVIVPDKEIGTLPFAALATQAVSDNFNKNYPFLLKKYTTNYLYSAGSFLQLQQKTANQDYCFAGIAPIEYDLGNYETLNHAEGELEGIKPLHWSWQREILKRETATKAAFERIIKEGYKTIQVSTHAAYDETGGQIIFHDSILNQDEIDQLQINTHRLILSACQTGVGKQNKGEGILSLGWNFAYKGVPSITMTHWSVNDGKTKDIMVHYHENLNEGISADQALQDAQLHYLNHRVVSDRFFHPHYWAAFIHTGNVD